MKILRLLFVMIALSVSAYSQSVVISEYKDIAADALGEWTEFVVLDENVSLANCTYRDNVTELNTWAGGITFKDIALWKNLKRGTIIVVHHRNSGGSYDDNVKDGYIEVSGDNTAYFNRYDGPTPDPTRPWDTRALSIAESGDIMELIDPSGNHIISLSHSADVAGSVWRTMSAPKPNCSGNLSGSNQRLSVAISPGGSRAAYSSSAQAVITQNTLGLPNAPANSDYWRSIREPAWSSPSLTITPATDGVNLSWTGSGDVFADFAGYMILRYKKSAESAVLVPKDGTVYNVGDKLGSAVVVKNVVNSTSYKDIAELPCGETYEYRVYAYRFDAGNVAIERIETNGRGRSYNQTVFAKNSFDKVGPAAPKVTINDAKVTNGFVKFCKGESRKLTISTQTTFAFQWFKDDVKIDGATALDYTVTESGNYYAVLIDPKTNCNVLSNEFNVTVVTYPDVRITAKIDAKNIEFKNDTTIYVCPGSFFTAVGADNIAKYRWYKDGVEILEKAGTKTLAPSESGTYFVKATNDSLCTDESAKITVIIKNTSLKFNPASLDFTLDATQSSATKDVTITNDNDYDIEIKTILKSNNFEVISPAKPYIIPAHRSIPYTIRFLPNSDSTSYNQKIQFNHDCATKSLLTVTGSKTPSELQISSTILNFPSIIECENDKYKNLSIILTNPGTDPIVITLPSVTSPFEIVTPSDFPITLANQGDSKSFVVRFNKTIVGNYSRDMELNYKVNGKDSKLTVSLNGAEVEPKLAFDNTVISITTFTTTQTKQTQDIVVTNIGDVDVTLTQPPVNGITFTQWPTAPIQPGASFTIKMEITHSGAIPTPYRFDIMWDKCNLKTTINITCSTTGYAIDEPEAFGFVAFCPDRVDPIVRELTINYIGSPENATINDIVNSANFSLDIAEGASVTDKMKIKVLFTGKDVKKYDEEIKFTLKPFDTQFTLKLSAEIFNHKIYYTDTLNFPKTIPNSTPSVRYIKISNPNPLPMRIISVSEPNPNKHFKKLNTGTTIPCTITDNITNPKDSAFVNFEYNPLEDGNHYADVKIRYSFEGDDCVFEEKNITLRGFTGDNDIFPIVFKIDAPKKVKVGSTPNIPILMSLDTTSGRIKYITAYIQKIEFDLEFNGTVVLPQNMVAEQSISADSFLLTRTGPNTMHCSFSIKEPESMKDGKLISIRSRFLWGNSTQTDFKISNIEFPRSKKNLKAEGDNAVINVFDECAFETGLLEIGVVAGGFKFKINNGLVSIDYQLVAEDYSTLEIYNTLGEQVFFKEVTAKQGSYSISIDQQLNAGIYFAVLRNGNFPRTVKFLITK